MKQMPCIEDLRQRAPGLAHPRWNECFCPARDLAQLGRRSTPLDAGRQQGLLHLRGERSFGHHLDQALGRRADPRGLALQLHRNEARAHRHLQRLFTGKDQSLHERDGL